LRQAFLCDGVRTPIGRYAGALAGTRADDLAAIPLRELVRRHPQVDWQALEEVVLGCANQAGEDNRNVARMAALLADLPVTVPGSTVNRLCGSGLEAVAVAARGIVAGDLELAIAGGVESMSRAPFVMPKAESPFARSAVIHDTTLGWRFVNPRLEANWGVDSMPQTAENLARQFAISRADQDAYALRSQQRTALALQAARFAREIVAVDKMQKREPAARVERDEHPRAGVTLDALAALPPLFPPAGTVTAGNSSGLNDGAAALIVASEQAARRHGLTPRARVVATATAGIEPRIMGLGPAPAIRRLLTRTGVALHDVDVIEINEAFAAQVLAVQRELGLADDAAHVNPNGGAIALGHPLGMSGARLALTALHELELRGGRRAIVSMCIGVGQGIAMLLERT
jgi:3-oxoadipyl-CoA thiolase